MNFGVEIDFSQTSVEELSDKFDRRENSPYLKDSGKEAFEKRENKYKI